MQARSRRPCGPRGSGRPGPPCRRLRGTCWPRARPTPFAALREGAQRASAASHAGAISAADAAARAVQLSPSYCCRIWKSAAASFDFSAPATASFFTFAPSLSIAVSARDLQAQQKVGQYRGSPPASLRWQLTQRGRTAGVHSDTGGAGAYCCQCAGGPTMLQLLCRAHARLASAPGLASRPRGRPAAVDILLGCDT